MALRMLEKARGAPLKVPKTQSAVSVDQAKDKKELFALYKVQQGYDSKFDEAHIYSNFVYLSKLDAEGWKVTGEHCLHC